MENHMKSTILNKLKNKKQDTRTLNQQDKDHDAEYIAKESFIYLSSRDSVSMLNKM